MTNARQGWQRIGYDEVEIHEQVGGGGVALVHRGYFGRRPVALKTLFDPKVNADLKKEYMDELLVMSELSHKNVVEFVGACMDPPHLFFVMELCDKSLHTVIHGRKSQGIPPTRLSVREKLQIATDVAEGMAYLHGRTPPVVHRDLKTLNVLQASDGVMKICDFGLVRTQNPGAGTPSYMAPELFSGRPFSKTVDVYAYGVLLCELFAEEVPFMGYDYADLKRRVPQGHRPDLPRFDTPADVKELIRDCWRDEPHDRPAFRTVLDVVDRCRDATPHQSACDQLDDCFGGGGDILDGLMGCHK